MKTYSVLFAEDVPHYGTAEITAANHEEAIAAATHERPHSRTGERRLHHRHFL